MRTANPIYGANWDEESDSIIGRTKNDEYFQLKIQQ